MPAHFSQKKLLILGSIVMVFLAVLFVIFSSQQKTAIPEDIIVTEKTEQEQ